MAGKAKRHLVDGKYMTVAEAAELLGVKPQALYSRMKYYGGGLQAIVNMYRDNLTGGRNNCGPRYMVDGQWLTNKDAARRIGVSPHALRLYRATHRDEDGNIMPLKEVMTAYSAGRIHPGGGRPKLHRVGRRTMTVAQAAELCGASVCSIYLYMSRHKCTLNQAVKYYEARRRRKAEKAIMEILGL